MAKILGLTFASIVALAAVGYFVTLSVLKPISTDLSVIGQGSPVLVLAYENFSPSGGEALERLRKIRAEYEPRIQFRVADLGTPAGRAFARQFGVGDAQTVFLKPDGQLLLVSGVPQDEGELRSLLDYKLAASDQS
jgi:hypothetical protein